MWETSDERRAAAEHPGHLGRRHRDHQPQLLQRRADGLPHAQHRPDRRRGHALHRLLRRAELHRGPVGLHHRPERLPHRPEQGRHARASDIGLQAEDPTIAELLKPLGYATGQFGKNHLGDLDKYLPTAHGFDEFFGNLYHLNAEEEPEHPDYPTQSADFPQSFRAATSGPRGVLRRAAASADGSAARIEDTGPLTRKRMETIDDETTEACVDFITRQNESDTRSSCG